MHNEVLHRITRFEEIDQHQLMDLYAEGNAENTDYFYPEIVAFHSDQVVTEPHQMGELVVTTLMAEAMPLIRYRTGQAVMMETDTCDCGRTLHRVTTPFTFM